MTESEDMEKARAKIERLEAQSKRAWIRYKMASTEVDIIVAKVSLAKLHFIALYPDDENDYDEYNLAG